MKLLLIRNDNIGDLACTTPLIELLREAYPEAVIDLLGNSYNKDLLLHDPRISHLWSYGKAKHVHGLFKKVHAWVTKTLVLFQLRQQHYDLVIIAVPVFNKRTTSLAAWINPKAIYGAPPQKDPVPSYYYSVLINPEESHVLQVATYARALGINAPIPEEMSLVLSSEEKKQSQGDRLLVPGEKTKPIIGLQISARRPKQRWSLEQWKECISLLLPYARLRLFWSPGTATTLQHPGDDLLASELVASFPKGTFLAEPTTNLRSLMVAFSTCDLIMGSDGGAMHIAAALGIATMTLFGDINESIWRPYSKKSYAMKSPTDTLLDLSPQEAVQKVLLHLEIK